MNYYPALLAAAAISCVILSLIAFGSVTTTTSTQSCVTQQLNGYIICPGSQQPVRQAPVTSQTTSYEALGYTLLVMAACFAVSSVAVWRMRA